MKARFHELSRHGREVVARHPQIARAALISSAVLTLAMIVGAAWLMSSLQRGLPDAAAISRMGEMSQSTSVLDASDRPVFTIYKEQRIEVPLSQISPNLIKALIAIEDQRFYEHNGFDAVRIVSAAMANIRHGRAAQGGSTITQQLARQSFLTPDKTMRRKLQELILAHRIEGRYPKDRILELYLNKVYFGDGLYGAEAASRGYFAKHASELTIPEAALLAGLVKSPSSYAPTVNPQRAILRRNVVLQAMLDNHAISKEQWRDAHAVKLALKDGLRSDEPHGQYFKEQVRRELVDRFGWQRVYQGGLRVYSTIDMPMQEAAESAVAEWLKALDEKRQALAAKHKKAAPPPDAEPLQAALVALDPETGHVSAMVGGRDFGESHFNRAVQARRQPGSAFKPFVYAAALEAGYTPATLIDHLNDPIATVQGDWTPEDEHSSAGAMTMRTALRTSSNRAAVRMLQEVGISKTVAYAKSMGVGEVPSVPSLALGSGEVTLDTMTAAYAAFANHGLVPKPLLIRRVEEADGTVLYQAEDSATRAISPTSAFLMSSMLADVINAGTGNRARRLGFTLPAAGKTGTTNDFNDAWFIGFTPHLVAGVWVGFDQPHTIIANGFAADVAVPIWAKFMKVATKGDKPQWFPTPGDVTTASVCRMSGKLATEGCENVEVVDDNGLVERRSMVYTEYFARGTVPSTYCDLHPAHGILGKIAGLFGSTEQPPPPHAGDTGLPPVPTASSGRTDTPVAATDTPKKKRGFWSKIFGLGKDDKDDRKDDPRRDEEHRKKGPGR